MKTNLLTLVVTLTVGIILAGSLFMPILSDATQTEDTLKNEGYFYMDKISSSDEGTYTLSWSVSNFNTLVVNGVNVDASAWPSTGVTVATDGQDWLIRSGTANYIGLQSMGSSGGTSIGVGGSSTKSVDVTMTAGTITIVGTGNDNTTTTKTGTYTDLWLYSTEPTEYVMKKANKIAYIDNDDTYLAMGVTTVTQWNTVIQVTGDYDSFDAEIVFPTGVTTSTTDKDIIITENTKYINLYELDKLTFTVSDGTNSTDATYSYFIVPASVTAELSQHLDAGEIALLNALPILIIIGLVMLGVGAIFIRNRD